MLWDCSRVGWWWRWWRLLVASFGVRLVLKMGSRRHRLELISIELNKWGINCCLISETGGGGGGGGGGVIRLAHQAAYNFFHHFLIVQRHLKAQTEAKFKKGSQVNHQLTQLGRLNVIST